MLNVFSSFDLMNRHFYHTKSKFTKSRSCGTPFHRSMLPHILLEKIYFRNMIYYHIDLCQKLKMIFHSLFFFIPTMTTIHNIADGKTKPHPNWKRNKQPVKHKNFIVLHFECFSSFIGPMVLSMVKNASEYFSFVFYLFLCHLCVTFCNMPSIATFCFLINKCSIWIASGIVWPIRYQMFYSSYFFSAAAAAACESRIKWHSHELLMVYCILTWNEFLMRPSKRATLFIGNVENHLSVFVLFEI